MRRAAWLESCPFPGFCQHPGSVRDPGRVLSCPHSSMTYTSVGRSTLDAGRWSEVHEFRRNVSPTNNTRQSSIIRTEEAGVPGTRIEFRDGGMDGGTWPKMKSRLHETESPAGWRKIVKDSFTHPAKAGCGWIHLGSGGSPRAKTRGYSS